MSKVNVGKYAGETRVAIVYTAKCKRQSRGVLVVVTITTAGLSSHSNYT